MKRYNGELKLLVLVMVLMLVLTSCIKDPAAEIDEDLAAKSKSELIEMIYEGYVTVDEQGERIAELEEILKGKGDVVVETPAIRVIEDGTGRMTFASDEGSITLPEDFVYPNVMQAPSTGNVGVMGNITIRPTPTWTVRSGGSYVELGNELGISGVIKVGVTDEPIKVSRIQEEIFEPVIDKMPPSEVVYTNIFLDDTHRGTQAIIPTLIDEEPAVIRLGMIQSGDKVISYGFVYRGDSDSNKENTILSLLLTTRVGGTELKVDK